MKPTRLTCLFLLTCILSLQSAYGKFDTCDTVSYSAISPLYWTAVTNLSASATQGNIQTSDEVLDIESNTLRKGCKVGELLLTGITSSLQGNTRITLEGNAMQWTGNDIADAKGTLYAISYYYKLQWNGGTVVRKIDKLARYNMSLSGISISVPIDLSIEIWAITDNGCAMTPGNTYTFDREPSGTTFSVSLNGCNPAINPSSINLLSSSTSIAGPENVPHDFVASLWLEDLHGKKIEGTRDNPATLSLGTLVGGTKTDLFHIREQFGNKDGDGSDTFLYKSGLRTTISHDSFTMAGTSSTIEYDLSATIQSKNLMTVTERTESNDIVFQCDEIYTGAALDILVSLIPATLSLERALAGEYKSTITITTVTTD